MTNGTLSRRASVCASSVLPEPDGPAMSLRTSCWLLPQNEQYSSFSPEEDFSDMGLGVLPGHQNLVHDAVLYRVLGSHEKVALGVALDHLDLLLAVLGEDLVQPL